MKTRVAVLFGGKSVEHEVSVISGIQALMNIDKEKYDVTPVYITKKNEFYIGDKVGDIESYKNIDALLKQSTRVIFVNEDQRVFLAPYPKKHFGQKEVEIDVVLPVVHGTNEEDGALQGYLKTIGVPFGGCDVTASAVGMDKYIQKAVLKDNGIPVLPGIPFTTGDYADVDAMIGRIEKEIGYPVIVKPVNLGSSVGIGIAKDREELISKIDDAFLYAKRVLVEHAILNLREVNCSVLGDEDKAEASEIEEPFHTEEILSYKDKYESNGTKSGGSKGMASVSRKIPAEIPADLYEEVKRLAVKSFMALGCSGVARMDFMIDVDTNKLYFNEINTIPGSLSFYLWEPVGLKYTDMLTRLIELALKRARRDSELTFTFDTNILAAGALGGSKGAKGIK
ncbi:MAG: D-alanine--D-alanine ligase [Lachnospiraceae bacterium]|nr:D-alanine--D-alanine ligase [Lachnospiraceae bacterium]